MNMRRVMGRILIFLAPVFLSCPEAFAAEIPFSAADDLLSDIDNSYDILAADLDCDGRMDLVTCSFDGYKVRGLMNNGDGTMTATVIAEFLNWPRTLDAGDIDGDGDLDILAGGTNYVDGSGDIYWLKRETSGSYSMSTLLHLNSTGVLINRLVDLDGDGDLDHVEILYDGSSCSISWKNNTLSETGSVGWGSSHTIGDGLMLLLDLEAGDIDGDGDMDLVAADADADAVYWYENDGTPEDGWVRHDVDTGLDGAASVEVVDVDEDGDLDIVAAAGDADKVVYYENRGLSWTIHQMLSGIGGPMSVSCADMDADGDVDFIVSIDNDEVVWVENLGSDLWLKHSIDATFEEPSDALAVDLDGDGDPDISATSRRSNGKLSWWENETIHRNFAVEDPIVIRDGLVNPRGIATGDINGDGQQDVILGGWDDAFVKVYFRISDNAWWENTVDTGTSRFRDISTGDIDGDTDLDIVGATLSGDEIVWWASDGSSGLPSWTRHTVISSFDGAHAVEPADLDSDGDLDLVVAAFDGDEATIVINDDGVGGTWTKKTFPSLNGAYDVAVGDLNCDGKVDFVVSGYYADLIRININGDPWSSSDITGLDGPRGVALGDIDGDGDLDIVGAIRNEDAVHWYENDGNGGGWTSHDLVWGYLDDGSEVQVVDIDRDGDADILATGYGGEDVYLWTNEGDGELWRLHAIEISLDSPWQALAADLDDDGQLDLVLTAAGTTDSLSWYRNVGGQYSTQAWDFAPDLIEDGAREGTFSFRITSNGKSGEHDLELRGITMLFRKEGDEVATSTEVNRLIERLEVYLDTNGDQVWEEGTDTLLATDTYLSVSDGELHVPIAAGLEGNVVEAGRNGDYCIVLKAADDASVQDPDTIYMVLEDLDCYDRDAGIPTVGEAFDPVVSDFISFVSALLSDGFESGDTAAWDVTVP